MGTRSSTVEDNLEQELRDAKKAKRGTGVTKLMYDLVHRRRRFRQFVGVALVFFLSFTGAPTQTQLITGAVFATLGMLVRLWASGFVMKNEKLATSGPYGYVRHPLYVGNMLICIGFCFAAGHWWAWAVSAVYVWYFYPETIAYEDSKLRRLFTEEWDAWAARTRALIPRLTPFSSRVNTQMRLSLK